MQVSAMRFEQVANHITELVQASVNFFFDFVNVFSFGENEKYFRRRYIKISKQ